MPFRLKREVLDFFIPSNDLLYRLIHPEEIFNVNPSIDPKSPNGFGIGRTEVSLSLILLKVGTVVYEIAGT
jgi:hypothetical protein